MHWFLFIISVNVYVPKDRVTNLHQGYGFVEFRSEEDADYVSLTPSLIVVIGFIFFLVLCFFEQLDLFG